METPVSHRGERIPRWCKFNIGNVFTDSIERRREMGSYTAPHFPDWVIVVLENNDAYLHVPQQEEVLVTISS